MKILDYFIIYCLDDLLIYSKNTKKYEFYIFCMLQKFKYVELYAKLKKCVIYTTQVDFLRHIITNDGLVIDPKKF